ncbi:hypothetical protein LTR97_012681 [Elasticomyces elasticus]|uniref:Heterokaryon incompatibility domain-containing protein n=1 Tax=Elasticomyces elasticus TaxID=574655 RepID=A0AAN7VX69_9PEZI|nr:hypothetical protein LTR97_012681 [Elasticomyces elasticus]
MPTYVYRLLKGEEQEIRLLELGPGEYNDVLQAALVTVSVKKLPAYNTISYVWGDPSKSGDLRIGDASLAVPANTILALRRMRLRDSMRVVWIDAVCINQNDIHERGQQVGLMGTIYRCSSGNLVHLTDNQTLAERILRLAHQIDGEARAETDDKVHLGKLLHGADFSNPSSNRDSRPRREDLDSDALWSLLRLPWFRRLWILQEAVVSPSNSCYLGEMPPCPLNLLLRTVRWLEYTAQVVYQGGPEGLVGRVCILHLFELADREIGLAGLTKGDPQLPYLLQIAITFERSEPRDGIFALLGMLSKRPKDIVTDYTKSTQMILQETTRHVLAHLDRTQFLHPLNFISHQSDPVDICSWMCPYDRQFYEVWDPSPFDTTRSCAWTGLDDQPEVPKGSGGASIDSATITLPGLSVDTISVTSAACSEKYYYDGKLFNEWTFNAILDLSNCVKPSRADELPLTSEFLGNLARAFTTEGKQHGGTVEAEQVAEVTACFSALVNSSTKDNTDPKLFSAVSQTCTLNYLSNRRLFRTAAGRIGLGPKVARPGDVITVLRGGALPFILRPLDRQYQMIGAAYVSGIMHGEAVQEAHAKGLEQQVFTIR